MELEFLYATLAKYLRQGSAESLGLVREFCRNHYQNWLPEFAKALDVAQGATFYGILANLAQETNRRLAACAPRTKRLVRP